MLNALSVFMLALVMTLCFAILIVKPFARCHLFYSLSNQLETKGGKHLNRRKTKLNIPLVGNTNTYFTGILCSGFGG
ncbi:hypothetical protein V6Z11_A08G230900 [Gossypium hirsutum]